MPLLNFMSQFVEPIRESRKRHTIRADRKIPVKVGDKLYLYCGLRHKGAYRILPEPVTCTRVDRISIYYAHGPCVFIDAVELDKAECERLAVADGFDNFTEMMAFWDGRLPFTGQIIHWKP